MKLLRLLEPVEAVDPQTRARQRVLVGVIAATIPVLLGLLCVEAVVRPEQLTAVKWVGELGVIALLGLSAGLARTLLATLERVMPAATPTATG